MVWTLLFGLSGQATAARRAQVAPPGFDAGSHHLYLIPTQNFPGLDFLTHIVEVRVAQDSQSRTVFATAATYRWHNTQAEPLDLELRVRSRTGAIVNPVDGQLLQFGLYRDAVPIPLAPLDNGQYQTTLRLNPDQRLTLDLRYAVQAPARSFPRVAYDLRLLRRWLDIPDSMRVSFFPGFAPQPGNVLRPLPGDYALRPDAVRWLFEESWPSQTPEVHFLHKDVWEAIQAASQKNDLLALGQHYHALYMAVDAPASHRRLYYDQALAAFLQALDQAPGQAHYGLARLYRTQSLSSTDGLNAQYLELALHHAQMALSTLDPAARAQRQDVIRWLWQILEQRVNWAVQHEEWELVRHSLETIEALPDQEANAARFQRIQSHAKTQQAIRLMDQGQTEQALALAGPQILDPRFMPAPHLISLFTGWHADIRIGPDVFTAQLEGAVDVRQQDRIVQAVTDLEALLAHGEAGVQTTLALDAAPTGEGTATVPVLHLNLTVTNPQHAHNLAARLSANSEWDLLRHLLLESWPYMSQTGNPFVVAQMYEYTLDLSEVYKLWHTKALALEETAIAEASAGVSLQEETIRQMNFLNVAKDWRQLARNTLVTASLDVGRSSVTAQAPWVATEDQPAITMRAATRRLRLLHLTAFGVLGLLLAGGLSLALVRLPGLASRSSQTPAGP